ncbi:copper homeostasis protein [Stackebrandtia albiflava]|uniref:Copper homeostasis protein cutC homolog n=1 Tax=Stackebrandtia albiflava TaxID=406432 RepID=A0A562UYG2_9ACTN|nr:copper homeostasis protein CutC [Stackebrandtia albiflava]TWJ10646.1 copper homeostasis protein [Stackebrandtia albiflava]
MPQPASARRLLEVIALDAVDAEAAQRGGADRLELVTDMAADGLSPSPSTVSAIKAACDLPVRAMVRVSPDFLAADVPRLRDRAAALADAGADGLVIGFLTRDGGLDVDAMTQVAAAGGVPWTCHRAVDHAADHRAAVARAAALPGVDQILTAGSPAGLAEGAARVAECAAAAPVMAGGGLTEHHVPGLLAAGVTAFHIGSAARDDWDSPVDPARVAGWRALLDR